ncbi:MAG: hypothetical protein WHX53_11245, partial [Anaerolineae bacterium]
MSRIDPALFSSPGISSQGGRRAMNFNRLRYITSQPGFLRASVILLYHVEHAVGAPSHPDPARRGVGRA